MTGFPSDSKTAPLSTAPYRPWRLKAQAEQLQAAKLVSRSNHQISSTTLNDQNPLHHYDATLLARLAQSVSASPLRRALIAYTLPTSSLGCLPSLMADEAVEPDLREAAFQFLRIRLHQQQAEAIWHYYQHQPHHPHWTELLNTLVAQKKRHTYPVLLLIAKLHHDQSEQSTQSNQSTLSLGQQLIAHFLQHILQHTPAADVIAHYQIDLSSAFGHDLISTYFQQADQQGILRNIHVLSELLNQSTDTGRNLATLDHYYQTLKPPQAHDLIGNWLLQQRSLSDSFERLADRSERCFAAWQILDSLRRLLPFPRQLGLLSRFYYLCQKPAESFIDQAESLDDRLVFIQLPRLILLARPADESLYLYPKKLFDQAHQTFQSLRRAYQQALTALSESDYASDDEAITYPQTPEWPLEQSIVQPARQASLNEQEKTAEDMTLIEELVTGKKKSIIQLSLDDAHYLFARKLLEDLAAFEGLTALT